MTRVIIGTAAVRDPDFVREAARLYPDRIAVGVDARDGWVAVEGWARTSDVSRARHRAPVRGRGRRGDHLHRHSARRRVAGPQHRGTVALAEALSIPVIASGGLASIEDVRRLTEPDCAKLAGAIAGRALYDGRLDPREALALLRGARPGR